LFHMVRTNYYDLCFNRQAISIMVEHLELYRTLRQIVLAKVEAGRVSAVDVYRLDMEIGDLENQLARLKDFKQELEVRFGNLFNGHLQKPVVVQDLSGEKDLLPTREALLDSIRTSNHELQALGYRIKVVQLRQEIARYAGLPDFSLGIDYISVGSNGGQFAGNDAWVFPRVGIRVPLYRNKYRSLIKEFVHLEAAAQNRVDSKNNSLEDQFEKTWNQLNDARRRETLYSRQLKLATQAIHILESGYAADNRDFEEIIRMERKMLSYALERERALTDRQAAVSLIQYMTGK